MIGRAARYRDLSPGEVSGRMGKSTGFGVRMWGLSPSSVIYVCSRTTTHRFPLLCLAAILRDQLDKFMCAEQ